MAKDSLKQILKVAEMLNDEVPNLDPPIELADASEDELLDDIEQVIQLLESGDTISAELSQGILDLDFDIPKGVEVSDSDDDTEEIDDEEEPDEDDVEDGEDDILDDDDLESESEEDESEDNEEIYEEDDEPSPKVKPRNKAKKETSTTKKKAPAKKSTTKKEATKVSKKSTTKKATPKKTVKKKAPAKNNKKATTKKPVKKKTHTTETDKWGFRVGSQRSEVMADIATGKFTMRELMDKYNSEEHFHSILIDLRRRGYKTGYDSKRKIKVTAPKKK